MLRGMQKTPALSCLAKPLTNCCSPFAVKLSNDVGFCAVEMITPAVSFQFSYIPEECEEYEDTHRSSLGAQP